MFEIRIKGSQQILEVSDAVGKSLKEDWKDFVVTRQDKVIEVKGWSGKLSDLRDFREVPNPRSQGEDHALKTEAEFRATVVALRKLSAKERALRLGLFKIFYLSATKQQPDRDTLTKAAKIQLDYFTENPLATVCDFSLFKPLVGRLAPAVEGKEGMKPIRGVVRIAGFNLVTEAFRADLQARKTIA